MIEDKRVCPNCGHQLHRRPYLMSVNPDAPGLIGILRGERGNASRLALTVAICVLGALILIGLMQL